LLITHHVPWNDIERTLANAATTFDGPLDATHPCDKYTV